MSKAKTRYEVRYFITDNVTDVVVTLTNREEAVVEARYRSEQEEDRIYFVKRITEQVVFVAGERG